jgi:hypothetical protein
LPFFPKDLVSMKGGHGFHETCNEAYINAYRNGLMKKYTKEEADQMVPPPLWEYTRAPWYVGLLIKIFRRDPQLALQVADVMNDKTNLPISRAEIKRQKQVGNAAARVQIPMFLPLELLLLILLLLVGFVVSRSCRRSSKSNCSRPRLLPPRQPLNENTNIAKRIAKMEELGQGMTL